MQGISKRIRERAMGLRYPRMGNMKVNGKRGSKTGKVRSSTLLVLNTKASGLKMSLWVRESTPMKREMFMKVSLITGSGMGKVL